MKYTDYKYLIAYIGPIFCWLGLYYKGWFSPGMFFLAFILIPLIEYFIPFSDSSKIYNEKGRKAHIYFDILLYLHIPIVYSLLAYFFLIISNGNLRVFEYIGLSLNMGTLLGAMGINIGHELGHRPSLHAKIASWLLLLPALYLHFQIEHNLGHHKNVATPKDPSSAKKNESVYLFWIRSVTGAYFNAWNIENKLQASNNRPIISIHNKMIWFTIIECCYLLVVLVAFGWFTMVFAVIAAGIAILLLESVNYIEHYGLRRKKLPSGRYEAVQIHHSWNSNHPLGRIFLFELTRHADHHYKSTRPYQVLRHFKESPQLPMGYPAAILLSLIPFLWFQTINPLIEE